MSDKHNRSARNSAYQRRDDRCWIEIMRLDNIRAPDDDRRERGCQEPQVLCNEAERTLAAVIVGYDRHVRAETLV